MRWQTFGMVLAMVAPAALAAEGATTLQETELKAEPFADAQTVAKLPAQAPLDIVRRQGAWMQIKARESQGWLRMLAVRLTGDGAPVAAASGEERAGAAALSLLGIGGRSMSPTVATGVRGLSEEDMKNAKPNPQELEKLDGHAVTVEEARRFAEAAKLKSHEVPYLVAPAEVKEDGK